MCGKARRVTHMLQGIPQRKLGFMTERGKDGQQDSEMRLSCQYECVCVLQWDLTLYTVTGSEPQRKQVFLPHSSSSSSFFSPSLTALLISVRSFFPFPIVFLFLSHLQRHHFVFGLHICTHTLWLYQNCAPQTINCKVKNVQTTVWIARFLLSFYQGLNLTVSYPWRVFSRLCCLVSVWQSYSSASFFQSPPQPKTFS